MDGRPSRWATLWRRLGDPITVRKRAAAILPILATSACIGALLGGGVGGFLSAFGWVLLLPASLALGYGEAFFIGHGRGVRRATLLLISSATASFILCAILSTSLDGGSGPEMRVVRAIVTLVLFVTASVMVACLAALGFGLGTGYLARKIAERSTDEWP